MHAHDIEELRCINACLFVLHRVACSCQQCFHVCNGRYAATVGEANCHVAKTICGGETPCERVYFTGRS